jgi:ribose 5-phosphate isomerase B
MRLAIAADHNGRDLLRAIRDHLEAEGHEAVTLGPQDDEVVDYPLVIAEIGEAIRSGQVERGIMIGGTGAGESIAGNKMNGIRAVLCSDHLTARISRENNDANLLVLGAMLLGPRLACELTSVWVETTFAGGRHARRLEQIRALEQGEPLH